MHPIDLLDSIEQYTFGFEKSYYFVFCSLARQFQFLPILPHGAWCMHYIEKHYYTSICPCDQIRQAYPCFLDRLFGATIDAVLYNAPEGGCI